MRDYLSTQHGREHANTTKVKCYFPLLYIIFLTLQNVMFSASKISARESTLKTLYRILRKYNHWKFVKCEEQFFVNELTELFSNQN